MANFNSLINTIKFDESYLFDAFSPVVNFHFLAENTCEKQQNYYNKFNQLHHCQTVRNFSQTSPHKNINSNPFSLDYYWW